ncbi:class I SAM-dependent methyltransferase [Bacteriovoracaceae bacterium]|nr:class I SAM-dependent methyltransferase [Bacteriovoracaceae bacterium]
MLKLAKNNYDIEFINSKAEKLPFDKDEFDFLNISMGFHWLDPNEFFNEARRVLKKEGYLCIDNYGFSGIISEDVEKQEKHKSFLLKYLPPASRRKGQPDKNIFQSHDFRIIKEFSYSHYIEMNSDDFVNLIMTWSNFQIKSIEEKAEIFQKMSQCYEEIFDKKKLNLEFQGKVILYS